MTLANYISKIPDHNVNSPVPSRTTSTSSISWTSAPSKLPKIASGFFQQATRMNWLDDKTIFNWGTGKGGADENASDITDDVFFYLDKFYGGISGRNSRSGSVSESDSKSVSRNRSRNNSISSSSAAAPVATAPAIVVGDGFKIEGMTPTATSNNIIPSITVQEIKEENGKTAKNVTSRRIFRIDDVEEEEEEEEEQELNKLAITQQEESKKDI